jgi:hypothetical protein
VPLNFCTYLIFKLSGKVFLGSDFSECPSTFVLETSDEVKCKSEARDSSVPLHFCT